MSNYNLSATETIKKLSESKVWHEVQKHDYYTLVGIQGRDGNNFYWFKVFNDDDTMFFDHCYHWGSGKTSRGIAKFRTAYNTINRLIK